MLLRDALGDTLRDARTSQSRTLRDVSTAANVSLGYLSEVERGRKEASSELLASICEALDLDLSDVLVTVSDTIRRPMPRATRLPAVFASSFASGLKSIDRLLHPRLPAAAKRLIKADDREQPGQLGLP